MIMRMYACEQQQQPSAAVEMLARVHHYQLPTLGGKQISKSI
jgi:hypothetical protein